MQLKNTEQLRPRENVPHPKQEQPPLEPHHPMTPALHVDEPSGPRLDSSVTFGATAHQSSMKLWSFSTSKDKHPHHQHSYNQELSTVSKDQSSAMLITVGPPFITPIVVLSSIYHSYCCSVFHLSLLLLFCPPFITPIVVLSSIYHFYCCSVLHLSLLLLFCLPFITHIVVLSSIYHSYCCSVFHLSLLLFCLPFITPIVLSSIYHSYCCSVSIYHSYCCSVLHLSLLLLFCPPFITPIVVLSSIYHSCCSTTLQSLSLHVSLKLLVFSNFVHV